MSSGMALGRRSASSRYVCTKLLLVEGRESVFTEHCRRFENSYRVLQTDVQRLKDAVQEMHRDLTKHHSLIHTDILDEVLERSRLLDQQIASQCSAVQTQRAVLQQTWDVTFQGETTEQDVCEAQLHDLLQLKQENSYLMIIARHIGPYVSSIAKVAERLELRFQKSKDDCMDITIKICDDGASIENQNSDEDRRTPSSLGLGLDGRKGEKDFLLIKSATDDRNPDDD